MRDRGEGSRLEVEEGLAELAPFEEVGDGAVEAALGESHHLGPDPDPTRVQRLDCDLVALPQLTAHGGRRHL